MPCCSCKGGSWGVLLGSLVLVGGIMAFDYFGQEQSPPLLRTLEIGDDLSFVTMAPKHIAFSGVLIDPQTNEQTPFISGDLGLKAGTIRVDHQIPADRLLRLRFAASDDSDQVGALIVRQFSGETAQTFAEIAPSDQTADFTYEGGSARLVLSIEEGRPKIDSEVVITR